MVMIVVVVMVRVMIRVSVKVGADLRPIKFEGICVMKLLLGRKRHARDGWS